MAAAAIGICSAAIFDAALSMGLRAPAMRLWDSSSPFMAGWAATPFVLEAFMGSTKRAPWLFGIATVPFVWGLIPFLITYSDPGIGMNFNIIWPVLSWPWVALAAFVIGAVIGNRE